MRALFHPECPRKSYFVIESLFDHLGIERTADPDADFDFAVLWQRRTWMDRQPPLERLARRMPVINLACLDISKRRVDQSFRKVFGYTLLVDPLRWRGRGVKKRDEDSVHGESGSFVECPLGVDEIDGRYVYQRFIDTIAGDRVIEHRVPVILGEIPEVHALEKLLPAHDSVKTEATKLTVIEPEDAFSPGELARILEFARDMGLDMGEIDVLRDPASGRIYLLDANKNPSGYEKVDQQRQAEALRRALAARGICF